MVNLPARRRAGHSHPFAAPSELRQVLRRGARRGEQTHRIAVLVDMRTVAVKRQIVNRATLQIDGAGQSRRLDRHPLGRFQCAGQILFLQRDITGISQPALARALGGGHFGTWLGLFSFRLLCGIGGLMRVEPAHGEIPTEQQEAGQHHRQNDITLIIHAGSLIRLGSTMHERALRAPDHGRVPPMGGSAIDA